MQKQKVKHESLGFGSADHLRRLHYVSPTGGAPCGSGDYREGSAHVSSAIAAQNQEYAGAMEDFDTGHDGRVFDRFKSWRSSRECVVFANH